MARRRSSRAQATVGCSLMISQPPYAAAAIAALFLCAAAAHADSVAYGELLLSVSAAEGLQDSSVALTVRGESLVVAKAEAGKATAMIYAKSPPLLGALSASERLSLVRVAAGRQDLDVLRAALSTLLRDDFRREPGELAEVSRAAAAQPQGALALAQAVSQDVGAGSLPSPCEEISGAPAHDLAELLRAGLPCQESSLRRAAELFVQGSIDEGIELLEAVEALAPQPMPSRWPAALREAVRSAASGDREAFSAALNAIKDSPFRPDEAQRAETGILRELLRVSMAHKQLDVGLLIVFRGPFSRRTDMHHRALLQALLDRPEIIEKALSEAEASDVVVEYARKDDDIRRALVAWAEGRAQLAPSGVVGEELLESIWKLRDPDGRRYPALERRIIALLRARGQDTEAGLLEGAAVWRSLALLLPLAGMLVALLAAAVGRRVMRRCETAGKRPAPAEATGGEELQREYAELLSGFNLSESASLADIKSAYRRAIKGLHPDHNNGATGASSEAFIALKQRHEQLLRLHRLAHPHGDTSRSSRRAATG